MSVNRQLVLGATRLFQPNVVAARTMYPNRMIDKFYREKRQPEAPITEMTKLSGVHFLDAPHRNLSVVYHRILATIHKMPEDAAYRKYTEAIVNERLKHVEAEPDVIKLEERIGMGMIEEVFIQAQNELFAARQILKYQAYDKTLDEEPELEQWRWPV